MKKDRKGFAIMLVLMMLFLLFMPGVAFFFSAWTHAFMVRNYLNMKRAFVVAEGGIHHAMGTIIGDFSWTVHAQDKPVDYRWKYWGNIPPGTP
jgi:type II secretory pathway component PulK